jgi:hypothetical protein
MKSSNTQEKIYNALRLFCFYLGFFSIGCSIFLWQRSGEFTEIFLLKLHNEHLAIWLGLWAPTSFSLSLVFDRLAEKIKKDK